MSIAAHEIQGSEAWLEYRRTRGGASELPALMHCSPWAPRSAAELFDFKTGRRQRYNNPAMRHGTAFEAEARNWAEGELGDAFEPKVLERGRIIASLDGINMEGSAILELKCPPKGGKSKAWLQVQHHHAPDRHYWWQVQQQLYVSGAQCAYFAIYDAQQKTGIVTTVKPDRNAFDELVAAWERFFTYFDADKRPPDDRPNYRRDKAWETAATAYQEAKAALDAAKAKEAAARKALEQLADGQSTRGAGVCLTRYWAQGRIDYKHLVPADADIESARAPGRWQTKITQEKEAK